MNYSALPSSADKVMYPLSLCRKLAGKGLGNVPETDAVIHINSNAQWCVGAGRDAVAASKSLAYAMLMAMASALGFGSGMLILKIKYDGGEVKTVKYVNR